MLFEAVGSIDCHRHRPYVYFIVKGQYLYIGETQDHPVCRWGGHLNTGGTFDKRLREYDEEALLSDSPICFWGFECSEVVRSARPIERRRVTQYIEHKLHVAISCHTVLARQMRLISDTSRTYVTYCRYDWADELVEGILGAFADACARRVRR